MSPEQPMQPVPQPGAPMQTAAAPQIVPPPANPVVQPVTPLVPAPQPVVVSPVNTDPVLPQQPAAVVAANVPAASGAPNIAHSQKMSIWFGVGGLVVFVVGVMIGFAALIGAGLGIAAIQSARPTKYAPGLALGIIAVVLNVGIFILASVVK